MDEWASAGGIHVHTHVQTDIHAYASFFLVVVVDGGEGKGLLGGGQRGRWVCDVPVLIWQGKVRCVG